MAAAMAAAPAAAAQPATARQAPAAGRFRVVGPSYGCGSYGCYVSAAVMFALMPGKTMLLTDKPIPSEDVINLTILRNNFHALF